MNKFSSPRKIMMFIITHLFLQTRFVVRCECTTSANDAADAINEAQCCVSMMCGSRPKSVIDPNTSLIMLLITSMSSTINFCVSAKTRIYPSLVECFIDCTHAVGHTNFLLSIYCWKMMNLQVLLHRKSPNLNKVMA